MQMDLDEARSTAIPRSSHNALDDRNCSYPQHRASRPIDSHWPLSTDTQMECPLTPALAVCSDEAVGDTIQASVLIVSHSSGRGELPDTTAATTASSKCILGVYAPSPPPPLPLLQPPPPPSSPASAVSEVSYTYGCSGDQYSNNVISKDHRDTRFSGSLLRQIYHTPQHSVTGRETHIPSIYPSRFTNAAAKRVRFNPAARFSLAVTADSATLIDTVSDLSDSHNPITATNISRLADQSPQHNTTLSTGLGSSTGGDPDPHISTDPHDDTCTVVMALCFRHGQVGAACFNCATSTLQLFEDSVEDTCLEVCKSLMFQTQPNVVLTFARADQEFLHVLQQGVLAISTTAACELLLRPTPEFTYESGKSKLLSICWATLHDLNQSESHHGEGTAKHREQVQMVLEGIVQLKNREMVGSAGALLSYLALARLSGNLSGQEQTTIVGNTVAIRSVENISLANMMQISVNAMVDGSALLKQWIARPLLDLDAICQRQDSIEWFLRCDMCGFRQSLQSSLKHLRSLPMLFRGIQSKFSLLDWQALHQYIFHALTIRNCIQNQSKHSNCKIVTKIDFDSSKKDARLVIKADVDEDLDMLKKTYSELDDILSAVAATVAQTLSPGIATSLNIVYFPQLGYLVAIPLHSSIYPLQDYTIEGLSFQFSTATVAYYKSEKMHELDDSLGDIHSNIVDRELEIMQQLRVAILEHSQDMIKASSTLTELDCILSLVEAALRYQYTRPTMTNGSDLHIVKGRHPLQELCVDTFVANDTHMGCSHPVESYLVSGDISSESQYLSKVMFLTGANFSGKSVYLHQVALIVVMAQIGSYVPAQSATIGLTDRILTRIHSDDSVSALKGSFLIDLQQIAAALANSTPKSLVVIDEFGKGTDSNDGIGLLCAVIESFADRCEKCPRVIAATHFHEILSNGILDFCPKDTDNPSGITSNFIDGAHIPSVVVNREILQFSTMKIVTTQGHCSSSHNGEHSDNEDGQGSMNVTFLYEHVPGKFLQSLGVHCAKMAGLASHVTKRAKQVSDSMLCGKPIPVIRTARDVARQQAAEAVYTAFQGCNVAVADLNTEVWDVVARFETLLS
ncbi:hypothetical protein BASA50_009068 [Batrachochytrium salamandrivorans]|uniref:DNA mismatch repair proteins mutS family domain-containing protein n=1 Tax=Batrachochytrium salamandrivorans TaxID=1357716 RepID=A0ABQ8F386_9FUNG|nr:hypothetical protein BASA50_009068 [Batrachochytrium salamandrivorans]